MHGLPQAIKDLTATKGIRTTQGSRIFKDFVPTADAIVVERVKRAGAIVIGKTNTPEFGLGSNTYNDVFGTHAQRLRPEQDRGRIERRRRRRRSRCTCCRSPTAPITAARCAIPPPTTTSSAFARRSAGCRPMRWTRFYAIMGTPGPMARNVPDLAALLVGAGRLRSARAAVEPAGPGAIRRTAQARLQGRAHRLGRRFRRPPAVRAGHSRSLQGRR